METLVFFYWFQGRNLLGDYQNFKITGDVKKGGESNIKRGIFFSFWSIKTATTFYIHQKRNPEDEVNDCFVALIAMTY